MIPDVCFIEDLVRELGVCRRTIEKLRRHGCFPIEEMPRLDSRPRWSGQKVRQFREEGKSVKGVRLRRVV